MWEIYRADLMRVLTRSVNPTKPAYVSDVSCFSVQCKFAFQISVIKFQRCLAPVEEGLLTAEGLAKTSRKKKIQADIKNLRSKRKVGTPPKVKPIERNQQVIHRFFTMTRVPDAAALDSEEGIASVEPVVVESGEDSDDSFSFSPIKKKTRREEVNESTTSEDEEIEEVSNEIENRRVHGHDTNSEGFYEDDYELPDVTSHSSRSLDSRRRDRRLDRKKLLTPRMVARQTRRTVRLKSTRSMSIITMAKLS